MAADAYERGRPGYPADAVRYVIGELGIGPGAQVVELGAGTGKFTRFLLDTRANVVPVEPVAGMRTALHNAIAVAAVEGSAESIPLADASADAIVAAQAFHWFDGDAALAEIHRVLRPHRRLGLIWNVRDDAVAWSAELTRILDRYASDAPRYRDGHWRESFVRTQLFGPLEHASFAHQHALPRSSFLDRVRSISFVAAAEPRDRDRIFAEVADLLDDEQLADRDPIVFPYRTDVFVATRR